MATWEYKCGDDNVENASGCLAIILVISVVVSSIISGWLVQSRMQTEAVSRDCAEWVVQDDGSTRFKWKYEKKDTTRNAK